MLFIMLLQIIFYRLLLICLKFESLPFLLLNNVFFENKK